MTGSPVSVIIATLDAGAYLAECLASVVAQRHSPAEIIVVDGGSTDDTAAIVAREPAARMIEQNGRGFAGAWNDGIAAAQSDLVAFIDSDDRWTSDKLALQVAMLDADPALDAVIGRVRFFLEPGQTPPRGFRDKVLAGEHVAQMPGVLTARRRLFERIGPWPTDFRIASDIDWFVRLKDSGCRVGIVDALLLEKRVHGGNLSYVTAADRVYPDEVLRLLHQSIVRKRAAAG